MEKIGWIKLYRPFLDSQFGGNLEMIGLFTSLLLMTNHKVGFAKDGTRIERGSFMTSQKKLSSVFNIDRLAMRRKLKMLENAHQIKQQTSNKNTIITIVNWDKFQGSEQQNEHQVNIKRTSDEHQVNTNKNDNNNNNEKNERITLSPDDISTDLFDNVLNSWNTTLAQTGKFSFNRGLKSDTKVKFFDLIKLNPDLRKVETWIECFEAIKEIDTYNGENDRGFVASLVWLIDSSKIVDVLNGQFCGNKLDFSKVDYS